ncbi:MAG: ABC transporter substrate-binding protein [Clostridia bacterium]|nr:ABC transporter substrate-binding protein [Clostridia bacterium]
MRRFAKLIMLLAALSLAVAGCGGGAAKDAAGDGTGPSEPGSGTGAGQLAHVNLTEVVRSLFYTPEYVALSKGFFKEEGLDVELTTAGGSDKGATQLLSGQADIALVGPETGLYIMARGTDKPLRLFAELTATDGSLLVCKGEKRADFQWTDLKGKTVIGNRPGSSPEMVLETILRQNGLEPGKDVTVVTNIANAAVPGAFKDGDYDCAEMWEPVPEMFEANGWGYVAASPGEAIGRLPYTAFLARQDMIDAHPDTIQRFTNAVYRALKWTYTAPVEEVAAAVAPFFPDTPAELLQKSIQRYRDLKIWTDDLSVTRDQMERYEQILMDGGQLQAHVAYDDYVITTFWEKAKQAGE